MVYEAIKNFPKQFAFEPEIIGGEQLPYCDRYIICGMGGSGLAGRLLQRIVPSVYITLHQDYGLPSFIEGQRTNSVVIASSHSGNTEEVLSSFNTAVEHDIPCVAVGTGGKLIELAQSQRVPHIPFPGTGVEPRLAIGHSLRAHLAAMRRNGVLRQSERLQHTLDTVACQNEGRALAKRLEGHIVLIYASRQNHALGYIWKITMNETGKSLAFSNVFPELNHNEIEGFRKAGNTGALIPRLYVLIIKDPEDHERIQKRMDVFAGVLRDLGVTAEILDLNGDHVLERLFSNIVLAEWTAYYVAEAFHSDPEKVELIEEFKRLIA